MIILKAIRIEKSFTSGGKIIKVLNKIDFSLKNREMIAIMGVSGSGKSTLLHILGLINPPDRGELNLLGEKIDFSNEAKISALRNKHLGFVFQFYSLIGELTVKENILLPSLIRGNKLSDKEIKRLLDLVKLPQIKLNAYPHTLSGGELQRVALARALVNSPEIIIADEPTANLDKKASIDIVETMKEVKENRSCSFVIATHSLNVAERCDRILYLSEGVLSEKSAT